MPAAAHVHCLLVPQGYSARDAWFETWIWGKPLVPEDTPCARIVWWCMSTGCPEGLELGSTGPYDQDAST